MPTIHKPQLDHAPFPWHERPNEFQKELEAQRLQILELSGFNKEFGDPADAPSNNTERQGTELIRELTGYGSRTLSEQRCLLFYWDSDIGRPVPELDREKPVSIISTDQSVGQSGRRIRARARELQF